MIHLKFYIIKFLAGLLRGLGSVRSLVAGFFRLLLSPISVVAHFVFRNGIVPLYRLGLFARREVSRILLPAKSKFLFLSAHRYMIHGVMVVIVAGVSLFNINSFTARADSFGNASLFNRLVHGDPVVQSTEELADLTTAGGSASSYLGDGTLKATATFLPDLDNAKVQLTSNQAVLRPSMISDASSDTATRTTSIKYTVQDSDTLWDIAIKFGIDVPTLLAANNLGERGLIHPGDELIVLPVSGVSHTVKSGETLGTIASKYQVATEDIARTNRLADSSILKIGDELIIPGGSKIEAPKPKPAAPKTVAVAKPRETSAAPVEKLFVEPAKPSASTAVGAWVWPTTGHYIVQPFKGSRHTGVDIDGQIGTPIYAAGDGDVEFAGWSVGYGLSIVVNHHNGYWTRYGHTSEIYVKIGDKVSKGQTIALMGTTGQSTGSHLHFEFLTGPGAFVNPLKFVH